jgi:L-cysteine S-thiosulfotransferase
MARRCAFAIIAAAVCAPAHAAPMTPYEVVGDSIPAPLGGLAGDPARGRAIIVDRQKGLCLLCHTGPFPDQRFQGDIAPDLAGAGSRLSEGQLRLRMVDSTRVNADRVMPSYYRIDHLSRVGRAHQGKPILEAQEVEDVVAFLATLRDPPSMKETR